MPAVVRIKRRIDEEPHSAFVLNGKRRRLLNDEEAPAGTPIDDKDAPSQVLLKFAGTIEKQDDSATRQFAAARLNKATARELVRQTVDPAISSAQRRDKQRQEAQQMAREQRYRVVNCRRSDLLEAEAGDASSSGNCTEQATPEHKEITIVDVEAQQLDVVAEEPQQQLQPQLQQQQQPADSDIGYVYDLYVPETELQADYVDMLDDNYLSLRPVDEICFEDCFDDLEEDYDSEDSNQENYYANEYPDDDAGAMGSDEELCQQMNKFMLDDDEDEFASGSSEAEDYNTYQDPYVHTIDTEADGFVDDVDFCNVDRQGSAYERYKRRILREVEGLDSQSESSDEEEAYFESASENGHNSD